MRRNPAPLRCLSSALKSSTKNEKDGALESVVLYNQSNKGKPFLKIKKYTLFRRNLLRKCYEKETIDMKGEHSYPLPLVLRPKPVRLHFLRNTKMCFFEKMYRSMPKKKASILPRLAKSHQYSWLFHQNKFQFSSSASVQVNRVYTIIIQQRWIMVLVHFCFHCCVGWRISFLFLECFLSRKKQNLKWDKEAQSNTHPLFPFLAEWFVQNLVL